MQILNKTVEAFRILSKDGILYAEGLWRISILSAEGAKKNRPFF